MADRRHSTYPQLLRELYFNRTGILFLLMALFSILMLLASARTKGTVSQFWLGIGAATIATTIYSVVQVLLTTRQFNTFLSDAIKSDIREAIDEGTAEAMETWRSTQAKYVPVATYERLDAPNPSFNRDLNACLSASEHYLFRGMSARYAVARLSLLPRTPRDVVMIIADPTKPAAADFRARHDAGTGDDVAFNRAKQEIIDGIYMAIAGAYVTRHRYDHIEFGLTPIPHVDRVEICDNAIFVSRFSENEGPGSRFPSTVQFGRNSLVYQMFSRDCSNILSSPYLRRLELQRETSEEEFLAKLNAVDIVMDMGRWAEMKQRFEDFKKRLSSELMP